MQRQTGFERQQNEKGSIRNVMSYIGRGPKDNILNWNKKKNIYITAAAAYGRSHHRI